MATAPSARSLPRIQSTSLVEQLRLPLISFMRFRRLTAALSGLCVLSLTLGQWGAACSSTSATDGKPKSSMASEHAGMPQHDGRHDRQKPCESSAIVCCQAMTSCGMSMTLSASTSREELVPRDNRVPQSLVQFALDRIIPPDPPPPKA